MKKVMSFLLVVFMLVVSSAAFAGFSNTPTSIREIGNGYIIERGTWIGADITTGTIAGDVSGTYSEQGITDIERWGFAIDEDNAVIPAKDVAFNSILITFTSGDTGDYWIIGKAR